MSNKENADYYQKRSNKSAKMIGSHFDTKGESRDGMTNYSKDAVGAAMAAGEYRAKDRPPMSKKWISK
jgi:hypothetical protein